MTLYAGARPENVPVWERRWPGRLQHELDKIAQRAIDGVVLDDDALAQGKLQISFKWPRPEGGNVALRATFPSSFPRLRPQVLLLADPEAFPDRHVGPNGELCLLGRDSGYWGAGTTLASLLTTNLESALTGSGLEDPQGEPAEVWWNTARRFKYPNYLLVDSAWDLSGCDGGIAEIIYHLEIVGGHPKFQAAVDKIWDGDQKTLLFERKFAVPAQVETGRRLKVTWKRDDDLPLPHQDQIESLADRLDHDGWREKMSLGILRVSLTVQATELQHNTPGDGFVCHIMLQRGKGKRSEPLRFQVPVYRAGETDVGYRVPVTGILRKSRIGLFGLGALGSPLAVELARNGAAELTLVDYDIVEPGNSVRWALGASSWGNRKVAALSEWITSEYPSTRTNPIDANIGFGTEHGDEAELVAGIIDQADVVIDASASTGVTFYLSDECRRLGKPMVSVAGTASLKGGTVTVYQPSSGCPICREHAYVDGVFDRAPGATDYAELTQPPGCGENTFSGASFDLQELTLQAVRATLSVLDGSVADVSVVQTLSLHDGSRRTLPAWSEFELLPSSKCNCAP